MIDVNLPLEIVHVDGRTERATFEYIDADGDIHTLEDVAEGSRLYSGIWNSDGASWSNCTPSWKLRNVTTPLDPTATWWAKRWWQSATDAEKAAMRELAGSE